MPFRKGSITSKDGKEKKGLTTTPQNQVQRPPLFLLTTRSGSTFSFFHFLAFLLTLELEVPCCRVTDALEGEGKVHLHSPTFGESSPTDRRVRSVGFQEGRSGFPLVCQGFAPSVALLLSLG